MRKPIQRLVDHNLCGPGLQGTFSAISEVGNVGEDVDERILEHVLQVFLIGDISRADAGKAVGKESVELSCGNLVAVLQSLDQTLLLRF